MNNLSNVILLQFMMMLLGSNTIAAEYGQSSGRFCNGLSLNNSLDCVIEGRHTELAQVAADTFQQPLHQQPQPAKQLNEVFRDCPDCPEMVKIAPGGFKMTRPAFLKKSLSIHGQEISIVPPAINSPPGDARRVIINKPFAIGKYEVTFEEWDACVAAGGCRGYSPDDSQWGRGRRPVMRVNWHDVQSYIKWLSKKTGKPYRLPNRFEWEYAARAGTTTNYYWGDEIGINNANCQLCFPQWEKGTMPVGSFPPNAFGLYDMLGNVLELVNCDYENCGSSTWNEDQRDQGELRGGSWLPGDDIQISNPAATGGTTRYPSFGFRLARTLP